MVCALSATQPASRHETLLAAFERIRSDHSIPALGIGIVDHGEVVFAETLGASPDARFRAASISKLLTAQAVMQLVETSKLSLDDDVGRYLPAFAKRGITIRQLLTHRAGLAEAVEPVESTAPARIATNIETLANAQPAADPGERWAYTDAEYNVLGAVIEAVSGQAYPKYVRGHVLAPLNISGATLFPHPAERANLPGAHFNYGFALPAPERAFDISFAPSEGLVSSTADLTRWVQATLREDARLLRAESYLAMLTPAADDTGNTKAGLGWQLGETDGRRTAQHGGSFMGHRALVLVYPELQRGFVILANAGDVPRWDIARVADAILDGRDHDLPESSRSIYIAAWAAFACLLLGGAWFLLRRSLRR